MKSILMRLVALILTLVVTTLCIGSCADSGDQTPEYDDEKQLTVDTVSISYSGDYIEKTNLRFGDVACAILEKFYGRELTPLHVQGIRMQFKKTFVPIFYRLRIDEKTLDSLLSSLEEYLESGTERLDSLSVLRELYERAIGIIGSEKTGKIVYELVLSNIQSRANTAAARYEEYGYPWYREEAEQCFSLSNSLVELGERKFIEAIGSLSFLYTVLNEMSMAEEEGFLLTETEMLYLVEYQAADMEKRGLSEDEWVIIGGIIDELLPEEAATARDALLYTLKNERFFTEALRACPTLISVYAKCAADLRRNEVPLSDTEALTTAILLSLTEGDSLSSLTAKISDHAKTESAAQAALITKFGLTDGFNRFAEEYPAITDAALGERLSLAATLTGEEKLALAKESVISYLMGTAPYAAYIFYGVN